ncbi:MAG TPA: FAD-dependent oxidoreductase [Bryobacteraceae bacterium]|nr:FAD-dependent oxidoreductase [Bryobacteraceae bacterium]
MAENTLRSIAFPTLTDMQIAQISHCAQVKSAHHPDGEILIATGDRGIRFFIVKSGLIDIYDYSGDEPRVIATHGPGQFSGDISHITGLPAIFTAKTRGETEALEVSQESLRHVLNQCPGLSDIILQAFIARRQLVRESGEFVGLRIIGSRYSADTFRLRDFLSRNRIVFTWTDIESEPGVDKLLKEFGIREADTPVVACAHMVLLRNPSNQELAERVGIHQRLNQDLYDLVVVGAGPAGLGAAVYGASEGLRTAVLESFAPGGQAGSSMRIENYLGFPAGLTGAELTDRAILQANKFGARLSVPTPALRMSFDNGFTLIDVENGGQITAKCLVIATGAQYRKLGVEGCERFEGTGVYYAAGPAEGHLCEGCTVIVVGGGNSAGQAAVFLASHAGKVLLVIRGDDLNKNMSSYLVQRISQTPNIELVTNTQIRKLDGNSHLQFAELYNAATKETRQVETPAVFSFIGATPRTEWLPSEIERDDKGFIRTGAALKESPHWTAARAPLLLETSREGIFAAGDVRSGSSKRVAAAVGEGAMSVQLVHEYLRQK